MAENLYRARAERGEVQIGTWVNMIRTPSVSIGGTKARLTEQPFSEPRAPPGTVRITIRRCTAVPPFVLPLCSIVIHDG